MKDITLIRESISKAEITVAFGLTKDLINILPPLEKSKVENTITLLEYQYTDIEKSLMLSTDEYSRITKNKIVFSLLHELSEIEITYGKLSSTHREYKKYQWATELNLANAYENLLYYNEKQKESSAYQNPNYKDYLLVKIQKLEKIYKTINRVNFTLGLSVALYFISESIKSVTNWDAQMRKNIEIKNYPYEIVHKEDSEVHHILLIDQHHLIVNVEKDSSGHHNINIEHLDTHHGKFHHGDSIFPEGM